MEIFKKIFIIGVQIFSYGRNIFKIFVEILFKCVQFFFIILRGVEKNFNLSLWRMISPLLFLALAILF